MQFAKLQGFEPLIPENWYKVTRSHITNTKVCRVKRSKVREVPKRYICSMEELF